MLRKCVEQHWYKKSQPLLALLFFPLAAIFALISKTRRLFFRYGIFRQHQLKVPVVIVGNISVGGVGKTPLTQHLALELKRRNVHVGVILRGYKSQTSQATIVKADDDSNVVGDEALIYAQHSIAVAIGKNRYAAANLLLKHYPEIQLILSDDGLQHYWLARDYEIVVVDSTRMFGNQYLLPMGPLREPISRITTAQAIVINGGADDVAMFKTTYNISPQQLVVQQQIIFDCLYNPTTQAQADISICLNKRVLVMCAMGNPQRFFSFVRSLGIQAQQEIAFADHYAYKTQDIPSNYDIILVTEKDYTKLRHWHFPHVWVVKISLNLTPDTLVAKLNGLVKNDR